jgi:hypothetical protein
MPQELNVWTPKQAAEWAGISYRQLLKLLHEGLLPAIPVGPRQTQKMGGGRKRVRQLAKYIIPRVAFIAAWESYSTPSSTPRRRRRAA